MAALLLKARAALAQKGYEAAVQRLPQTQRHGDIHRPVSDGIAEIRDNLRLERVMNC
jgi:hypothetical protein